jgi:hypothetical protein
VDDIIPGAEGIDPGPNDPGSRPQVEPGLQLYFLHSSSVSFFPTLAAAIDAVVLALLVDATDLTDLAGDVTAGLTFGFVPWAAGTEAASASSDHRIQGLGFRAQGIGLACSLDSGLWFHDRAQGREKSRGKLLLAWMTRGSGASLILFFCITCTGLWGFLTCRDVPLDSRDYA